jgi:hypothetical protein
MDTDETSAMTEASGLTEDLDNSARSRTASRMETGHPVTAFAEQSRRMTLAAPLPSLFAAFLFGIVVARRR